MALAAPNPPIEEFPDDRRQAPPLRRRFRYRLALQLPGDPDGRDRGRALLERLAHETNYRADPLRIKKSDIH